MYTFIPSQNLYPWYPVIFFDIFWCFLIYFDAFFRPIGQFCQGSHQLLLRPQLFGPRSKPSVSCTWTLRVPRVPRAAAGNARGGASKLRHRRPCSHRCCMLLGIWNHRNVVGSPGHQSPGNRMEFSDGDFLSISWSWIINAALMGTKVQKRGMMIMFVKVKCCSCWVLMFTSLITCRSIWFLDVSGRFGRDLYDLCCDRLRSICFLAFSSVTWRTCLFIRKACRRSESANVKGGCMPTFSRNSYRSVHSICMYLHVFEFYWPFSVLVLGLLRLERKRCLLPDLNTCTSCCGKWSESCTI